MRALLLSAVLLVLATGVAFWIHGRGDAEAPGLQPAGEGEFAASAPSSTALPSVRPSEDRVAAPGAAAEGQGERALTSDALESEPVELVLRVVSEVTGAPIPGAEVGGDWQSLTDSDGRARTFTEPYELSNVRWARVAAQGFVARHVQLETGRVEWEVALTPGIPFELRVVDDRDGGPIEGVEVRALQWDEGEREVASRFHGRTGTDGVVAVDAVRPGLEVSIELDALGYLKLETQLTIDVPERHEVRLGADGRISGRLLGFDGEPVDGALIQLDGARLARSEWGTQARTDAEGRFALAGLRLDTAYFLKCDDPRAVSRVFTLTQESPGLDVEMRSTGAAANLRVTVVDENGAPWERRWVEVQRWVSEAHLRFPPHLRNDYLGSAVTDVEGVAEIRVPEHGEYRVEVRRDGDGLVTERGRVGPGAVAEHRLVLPRGLSLRGRVVDHLGAPLFGMDVSFRGMSAVTDDAGHFAFHGLSSRSGDLYVYKSEPRGQGTPPRITQLLLADVVPGDDVIELRQPRPVTFTGRFAEHPGLTRAAWKVSVEDRRSLDALSRVDSDRGCALEVASSGLEWSLSVTGRGAETGLDVFIDPDPVPGSTVDLGVLGALRERTVSGRVWLPDRTPAAGATVDLYLDRFLYIQDVRADERGYFLFEGVPGDSGWFRARREDGYVSKEHAFEAGSHSVSAELTLTQEPLVHGHVRPSDGREVSYGRFWLSPIQADGTFQGGSGTGMKPEGSFARRVEPGTYRVIVTLLGSGEPILGPVVEVKPGEDLELNLELP